MKLKRKSSKRKLLREHMPLASHLIVMVQSLIKLKTKDLFQRIDVMFAHEKRP